MIDYFPGNDFVHSNIKKEVGDLLNQANYSYYQQLFPDAMKYFEEVENRIESTCLTSSEKNLIRSRTLAGLGKTSYIVGDYLGAVRFYQDFLDIQQAFISDDDTSIICPLIGHQDSVLLFSNSDEQYISTESIAIQQSGMHTKIREFLQKMHPPLPSLHERQEEEIKEKSAILYDLIIQPVRLRLKRHLIFILEGIMRYIPFSALFDRDKGKYLIEEHTIESIVSIGLEPINEENSGTSSYSRKNTFLLAIGTPITPDSVGDDSKVRQELNDIVQYNRSTDLGSLYGPEPLFKDKFNLEEIKEFLINGTLINKMNKDLVEIPDRKVRLRVKNFILHIVTHGKFDPNNPKESYLSLGGNSKLTVSDILESWHSNPKADIFKALSKINLVTLSACETAAGELQEKHDGKEIAFAIGSCFLQLGIRTVIASLWKVNHWRTSDLMIYFYKYLRKKGFSTAEALRKAQLSLIEQKGGKFSHPYYWSAFVVISRKF